jgi:hypothetical protein
MFTDDARVDAVSGFCGFLGVMEMLVGGRVFLLRTLGQMTVDQGVGVGGLYPAGASDGPECPHHPCITIPRGRLTIPHRVGLLTFIHR